MSVPLSSISREGSCPAHEERTLNSNGWSSNVATNPIGTSSSRAVSRSRPYSLPATRVSSNPNPGNHHRGVSTSIHRAFSCEIPEDPLHTALVLAPLLDHETPDESSEDAMIARSLLSFSHRPVSSIQPRSSALSAMLVAPRSSAPNPFASLVSELGAAGGGRIRVTAYFPHVEQPSGQLLVLSLPINATVEDAIALALWTYWEKCWLPALDASKAIDTDLDSWIVLVSGKDGIVNKRIAHAKIKRFNVESYAIVRSPRNYAEKRQIEKQLANFSPVRSHPPTEAGESPTPPAT